MAENDSTEQQTNKQLINGIYQIAPNAGKLDIQNHLDTRLMQLHAMLEMTYGGGQETFQNWSDEIQDNYMWACASLAEECKKLATHI